MQNAQFALFSIFSTSLATPLYWIHSRLCIFPSPLPQKRIFVRPFNVKTVSQVGWNCILSNCLWRKILKNLFLTSYFWISFVSTEAVHRAQVFSVFVQEPGIPQIFIKSQHVDLRTMAKIINQ